MHTTARSESERTKVTIILSFKFWTFSRTRIVIGPSAQSKRKTNERCPPFEHHFIWFSELNELLCGWAKCSIKTIRTNSARTRRRNQKGFNSNYHVISWKIIWVWAVCPAKQDEQLQSAWRRRRTVWLKFFCFNKDYYYWISQCNAIYILLFVGS